MGEILIYALIIIDFIVTTLSIDLCYWIWRQRYVHWKREKDYKKVAEKDQKKEYAFTYRLWEEIVISFVPIANMMKYAITIYRAKRTAFKYSTNYIIQDVVSWKSGLNSLLWKKWKPKKGWRKAHPVK